MQKTPFKRSLLASSIRTALVGSGAALAMVAAGPAAADEMDDLKDQVRVLMDRIDQLEGNQEVIEAQVDAVPANVVTDPAMPGTFKLPGSNTEVEVSGYIKLDAFYDFEEDLGRSFQFTRIAPDSITTAGGARIANPVTEINPHFRMHTAQSRFRIRSNTDLGNGKELKTHVEGDFYGGEGTQTFSNSNHFRLRHAYATYPIAGGTFLAGQTWTNFMDFVAYATTIDFFGQVGKSFVRQAQVRWTWGGLSFSIENPQTSFTNASTTATGLVSADELPDFTVAWRGGPGGSGGNYEIAAVLRDLGVNNGLPGNLGGLDESEFGWGVNLAGSWALGETVSLAASWTGGEGIGRYNGFQAGNGLFVRTNGSVEAVKSWSASAWLNFAWSDTSSSNLVFGHVENDDPARSNGNDHITGVHLNYLWNPYPGATWGVEAIWGERETVINGAGSALGEGDNWRLQMGFQQSF